MNEWSSFFFATHSFSYSFSALLQCLKETCCDFRSINYTVIIMTQCKKMRETKEMGKSLTSVGEWLFLKTRGLKTDRPEKCTSKCMTRITRKKMRDKHDKLLIQELQKNSCRLKRLFLRGLFLNWGSLLMLEKLDSSDRKKHVYSRSEVFKSN